MFSTVLNAVTAATTDFAEVFLQTHDPSLTVILIVLIIGGGILATCQFDRSEEDDAGFFFVLGALVAIGGLILTVGIEHSNNQISTKIAENMVSNVESKYGAKLDIDMSKDKLRKETTKDLDKPKQYTLIFKNGASAGYKMYFTNAGEPIIVDDEGIPTAKELNQSQLK